MLVGLAYYPFSWSPPRSVRNTVTPAREGGLEFGDLNRARTAGAPGWLTAARDEGRVELHLVVRPAARQAQSVTPIVELAEDYWRSDFSLLQYEPDGELILRVRRVGSDGDGGPPFVVDGPPVFRPGQWTDVRMAIRDDRLTVTVDGRQRLARTLPRGSLRRWTGARLALGGEVNGGGSWRGTIRRAEVRTSAGAVDYVVPGALVVPATFVELPDHLVPFPPPGTHEWGQLLFHFGSFVPVGFLLVRARRPPLGPGAAVAAAVGTALVIAAGKWLFPRHVAVADVLVEVAGAWLGIAAARRISRGKSSDDSATMGP